MILSLLMPMYEIEDFMHTRGLIKPDEEILDMEIPGRGNMNSVLRVRTSQGSYILKQASNFVQKYPQIPAPIERINVEYQFYSLIAKQEAIQEKMPRCLDFDDFTHTMGIEDLGYGEDYTTIYQPDGGISLDEALQAVGYLSALHSIVFEPKIIEDFPNNLALRKLNHEHLFVYPFMVDNGFDLDTIQAGLQAVAMNYKTNQNLKTALGVLGEHYLSSGKTLLHGDFYPGSWLHTYDGLKVIDPEFCFFGSPEYDLAILIAHLKMARTSPEIIEQVLQNYQAKTDFNEGLMQQYIGMELMRRLIGLAQLPLSLSLEEKISLLKEAEGLILA